MLKLMNLTSKILSTSIPTIWIVKTIYAKSASLNVRNAIKLSPLGIRVIPVKNARIRLKRTWRRVSSGHVNAEILLKWPLLARENGNQNYKFYGYFWYIRIFWGESDNIAIKLFNFYFFLLIFIVSVDVSFCWLFFLLRGVKWSNNMFYSSIN